MMSLSEWEAELKCSATGKPGELKVKNCLKEDTNNW